MKPQVHEDVLFGELRSLLQEPASEALWARLCDQLDRWPEEALEAVAMPYAASHLERWTDGLTDQLTSGLAHALRFGKPAPQLRLTRALTLWAPGMYQEHMRYDLDHRDVQHIRHLTIEASELSAKGVKSWSAAKLLSRLDTLTLGLGGLGKAAGVLAASKLLAHTTTLELRGEALRSLAPLRELCAASAPRLRALRLRGASLSHDVFGLLVHSPLFGQIDTLHLDLDHAHRSALALLATTPRWRAALHTLRLGSPTDAGEPLGPLFASADLARLTTLELGHDTLAASTTSALAACVAPLTALTLRARDAEALAPVLANPALAGLTALDLAAAAPAASAALAHALAASTHLSRLTTLDLSGRQLDGAAVQALCGAAHLSSLCTLRLRGALSPEHIAQLAASPHLSSLEHLDLADCAIGDAGAAALAATTRLTGLRQLSLRRCGIGAAGVAALARSPALATLRHMDLTGNAEGRDVIEALARSPHLRGCDYSFSSAQTLHDVARYRDLYLKYPEL